ncbi:MAG: hypothetical protein AB7F43_12215 [Bacteriovoracia bacterium]
MIEAVAAEPGKGQDRIIPLSEKPFKETSPGFRLYQPESREFPDRKVIFRIQNSFRSKVCQFGNWRRLGLVDPKDSFVIAINGARIDDLGAPDGFPYGVRAMFALGAQVLSVPVNMKTGAAKSEDAETYIQYQGKVQKQSGSSVDSDCFMSKKFKVVSGIIYTQCYYADTIRVDAKDIALIKNPFARNPVDDLRLDFGKEFFKVDSPDGTGYRIDSRDS